jgi:hypothetical protein
MSPFHRLLAICALAFSAALSLTAQGQGRIINAPLEERSGASGLAAEMHSLLASAEGLFWIGYSVPAIEGGRESCCGDYSDYHWNACGRCFLNSTGEHGSRHSRPDAVVAMVPAHLEGPGQVSILLRAEDHRINRVRAFSEECEVDADKVRVVWLTGVKPAESAAYLQSLMTASGSGEEGFREPATGALTAIALSAGPEANKALESFVDPGRPEKLRSQAAFWLGSTRGVTGLRVLERMAKSDPSSRVRAQVAFAYSTSHESAAVDDLIRMAHDEASEHVRGQALFWLAQKAGKRAAGAITEAIENDPDTRLKRSAVFALTQMPPDEGVPLLIQVARNNKNPEVRKQAFFWLGQSKDPRALAFFEEVLGR